MSLRPIKHEPRLIAGLDVAYDLERGIAYAAAVLHSYPALELLESSAISEKIAFPYITGLLSFRELPPLLSVLGKLSRTPDLLLVDGQGICHPRRLGLASHLGVASGIASIGAAKSHPAVTLSSPSWCRVTTARYCWLAMRSAPCSAPSPASSPCSSRRGTSAMLSQPSASCSSAAAATACPSHPARRIILQRQPSANNNLMNPSAVKYVVIRWRDGKRTI